MCPVPQTEQGIKDPKIGHEVRQVTPEVPCESDPSPAPKCSEVQPCLSIVVGDLNRKGTWPKCVFPSVT
jgi:hypothetical protein